MWGDRVKVRFPKRETSSGPGFCEHGTELCFLLDP